MSCNRLMFDNDAYRHQLKESIGPGEWAIGRPPICDPCFMPDVRADHFAGASCVKDLIDVDSELLNITRKASDCPSHKYVPGSYKDCKPKVYRECRELVPEDTRLSNGPCTLRGTGWNRWEWLPCLNPQDTALVPFDYNINNRIILKDTFRPCIPNPVCQKAVLPPKENMGVKYDWATRYTKQQQNPHDVQLVPCKAIRQM